MGGLSVVPSKEPCGSRREDNPPSGYALPSSNSRGRDCCQDCSRCCAVHKLQTKLGGAPTQCASRDHSRVSTAVRPTARQDYRSYLRRRPAESASRGGKRRSKSSKRARNFRVSRQDGTLHRQRSNSCRTRSRPLWASMRFGVIHLTDDHPQRCGSGDR
jgi:hypothetical protein